MKAMGKGLLAVLAGLSTSSAVFAAAFTPGNIVISRTADASAAFTGGEAAATFIDEYTPTGVLVQSIPLPTATVGNQRSLTVTWDDNNVGFITRSVNGQYLVIAGYDAPVGTAGVNSTANTFNGGTVDRVIGRLDAGGNIDTSTALSGDSSFTTNTIRSAATVDGTNFYATGATSNGNTGVRYIASLGATTSTRLGTSTAQNSRVINIFPDVRTTGNTGGLQLYGTRGGGSSAINFVGTGLPTNGNASANNYSAVFNHLGSTSVYDFVITPDGQTAYLTDDDYVGNPGGVQKWSLVSNVWTFQYVLETVDAVGSGILTGGLRGLTSTIDGSGNYVLYATSGNGQNLFGLTDTGANSVWTTLATAEDNEYFHGVELTPVPEPTAIVLLGMGGALCLRRKRSAM